VAALTVLALSVFAWGLQYKLSLYEPPHSLAREVPTAKLLSKNEQPQIASLAVIASPQRSLQSVRARVQQLALCLPVIFEPALRSAQWRHETHFPRRRRYLFDKALFVRPPPSPAFA
jgi:hypothetical protein